MNYVITLQIGKDVYQGTGDTVFEALTSLPKPAKIMGKGIFNITDGKRSRQILMMPPKIKQLFFTSPHLLEVKAKQLSMALQ